jgi:hypothetical protein
MPGIMDCVEGISREDGVVQAKVMGAMWYVTELTGSNVN